MGYIDKDYLYEQSQRKSLDELLAEIKEELTKVYTQVAEDERLVYLDSMEDEFWARVDTDPDSLDCTDVAAFATFICAKTHPEWNVAMCKEFFDQVEHSVTLGQALIGKSDKEVWRILSGDVKDKLGDLLNNSKLDKVGVCGTDRKPVEIKLNKPASGSGKLDDKEAVEEFLKFMGLK